MARLHLHPDRLEITLSTAEKTLALRKDNIVIPRSAIRSATLTDDPWIWVRGIRAPGAAIPLTLAVGQWKFHGGKDFLVLKGTKPSVVIDIADEEFSRVIITTKHGLELVAKLQDDVKPAKKQPRARKATPQVTPKPKRAAKLATDAPAPGSEAVSPVETAASAVDASGAEASVTPAKAAAARKPAASARKTPAAPRKTTSRRKTAEAVTPAKAAAEAVEQSEVAAQSEAAEQPDAIERPESSEPPTETAATN